jgi:hypothetical protein
VAELTRVYSRDDYSTPGGYNGLYIYIKTNKHHWGATNPWDIAAKTLSTPASGSMICSFAISGQICEKMSELGDASVSYGYVVCATRCEQFPRFFRGSLMGNDIIIPKIGD